MSITMEVSEFQAAVGVAQHPDMPASTKLVVAMAAVCEAWGQVCDHADARFMGEPFIDAPFLNLAVGRCMVAIAELCTLTNTNLAGVLGFEQFTDFQAESSWESRRADTLPTALARAGREVGVAAGQLRQHFTQGDTLDYQDVVPDLARVMMASIRSVCHAMSTDMNRAMYAALAEI